MSAAFEEVVGAVVLCEERVLLVRRGHAPMQGSWTLPGGHIEPGESAREAIARELFEETGLEVDVDRELETVSLVRGDRRYRIREFLCRPRAPDPVLRPGDDALDARWASLAELGALGVNREAVALVRRTLLDLVPSASGAR